MLGTRICLVPISDDKRVPDYNQSVQCGINPFLFLDIVNIPSTVLFTKEILNFTQPSPYCCSLKDRILCKRVCWIPPKGVYLLRIQKRAYYEMFS